MKSIHYIFLSSCIALASCSQHEKAEQKEVNTSLNVQVEKALPYTGEIKSNYSGVVEAHNTTALSFATMGTITEVLVEEGQAVSKEQLLAKVNSANAQNAYQAVLAKQQQAEDAYKRMKPMRDNGTLPEIKWVEVETGLAQAKAAVSIAQKNVHDCNLYAPVGGVIGKRNVQSGMNVVPTITAFELLNIQSVYVKIPVSENEVSRFKKGESALIRINAIDENVTGAIKEIGVEADIFSHTYPVKIEIQNTNGDIKPGMICSVQLVVKDNRSGFLISGKALQNDVYGEQFVYVEKSGRAEKILVKTIALIDKKVLVQGEVQPNANIIVSGQQKLSDGSLVKIIK